jgi:hypothetical protein
VNVLIRASTRALQQSGKEVQEVAQIQQRKQSANRLRREGRRKQNFKPEPRPQADLPQAGSRSDVMEPQRLENSLLFTPRNRVFSAVPASDALDAGQSDLRAQLRALETEKHNLLLLVADLLRKNEILRGQAKTSADELHQA